MTLKALFAASATAALLLALPASAAELTIGFSQIGSESGWRAAETSVSKQEAAKRKVNLKIADAQQKQETRSRRSAPSSRRTSMRSSLHPWSRPVGTRC
ncbi:ABC-type sugar transport system substrate-binding protein [Bradyrhizobium japonicum]